MAPDVITGLNGVLDSFLRLYGQDTPERPQGSDIGARNGSGTDTHSGALSRRYTDVRGMQQAVAATHAEKDAVVGKAVAATGDGTLSGRRVITNHIADLQSRLRAANPVADTRFAGNALLNIAHATVTDATARVESDVAHARKQAALIHPPAPAAPIHQRITPARRVRRRPRARARTRPSATAVLPAVHHSPIPSDGTLGGKAVSAASSWLDTPYVWGGGGATGPSDGGFDCSGLTQYAVAQATDGRVMLPRSTYDQIHCGERIAPQDVRPGDLVFPASSFSARGPEHVQLAANPGWVIESPHSGSQVKWSPMSPDSVVIRVM